MATKSDGKMLKALLGMLFLFSTSDAFAQSASAGKEGGLLGTSSYKFEVTLSSGFLSFSKSSNEHW